jgi:diguanylate cyclase (GGDEF)-like protein
VTARIDELLRHAADANGAVGCVGPGSGQFQIHQRSVRSSDRRSNLASFAKRIQQQVGRSDCFGRIGGEEFVPVQPQTPMHEAELIVERMLAAIRKLRPLKDPTFTYTFSAGIAEARAGETITDFLGRADQALHSAKIAGRNRIHRQAA